MKGIILQQFDDEWKKVSAVVESEARRQILTIGHLDYSMLNEALKEELSTWFKPNSGRHQWLEELDEDAEMDKNLVAQKISKSRLQDTYHVENKHISTTKQKAVYLLLSLFIGFLVWYGTDFYYTPSVQEYTSSPLKWIAFPLLATILAYTLCLPHIANAKTRQTEELIMAIKREMKDNRQIILNDCFPDTTK